MLSMTLRRWCLRLGLTAAVTTAMIAAIGASTAQATPFGCQAEHLCLVEPFGQVVNVGTESRSFKGGLPVAEIYNDTPHDYCDLVEEPGGGLFFSRIPAGAEERGLEESIRSVEAVEKNGICPG